MKNHEIWDSYYFYTGEVTKHARYLGFAGIAICWFFRTPEITFPPLIISSLVVLVVYFLMDLAQYYVSAMRLRNWMHEKEEELERQLGSLDGEYWPPKNLDVPAFWLFRLKLVVLLFGFLLIGIELVSRIFQSGAVL